MPDHEVSPWTCWQCGAERDLADFGQKPCQCGGHAIHSAEQQHRFTEAEMDIMARLLAGTDPGARCYTHSTPVNEATRTPRDLA